jgi:hypothetical protein
MLFRPRWRTLRNTTVDTLRDVVTASYYRCDLRHLGINAVFHSNHARGIEYQKLSFTNTASMCYSEWRSVLSELLECDPDSLEIARIDFALDLIDVPLGVLYSHIFARKKRYSQEFGTYSGSGIRQVETFYLGKRPNCIRVYDWRAKHRPSAALANQECTDYCVSRVERQCGGAGVPPCIRTFGQLKNAGEFDPFLSLRMIVVPRDAPPGKGETVVRMLARLGLQTMINERGMQQTMKVINVHSRGNASRIRRSLGLQETLVARSYPGQFERYQAETRRQLEDMRSLDTFCYYRGPHDLTDLLYQAEC